MNDVRHLLGQLLQIVFTIGNLLISAIITVELWLRALLAQLGVPKDAQSVLLIVAAVLLVAICLRLFGGLIRLALVLILVLIGLHFLAPVVPPPT